MQKVYYFKKMLWVLLIFVALLITFQACERDNILLEPVNKQNIKTVTEADAFYHLQNKTTLNRSGTSFVTEIDDTVVYDSLINSEEMLATIAVQTQFVNANSRILMIEINDTIQTAVYNMFSNNNFETETFYGDVLITDLDGNILNALKVEDDYYVAQYLLPENFSVSSDVYSRSSGCPECPEFADCNMCGELGEVVLNSTKKIKVTYIYCHFCSLSQGDEAENESIEAAEWGGGGGNPSACPPGYIKDDNNNCVPQCAEGEEWVESLQQCVSKCDSGFVRDIHGNCVKKPCEGDPVLNPEIASSGLSGKRGGTFGCTRVDETRSCEGRAGEKKHDGLDVKSDLNSSLFSMYSGTVTNVRNSFEAGENRRNSYGNFITITSNINGTTYNIKYNHLNSVFVEIGQTIGVGQIIGLTGNTGNAAQKGIIPHIHIQIYNSNYTQSLNPEDFLLTKFDENQNPIENDCN